MQGLFSTFAKAYKRMYITAKSKKEALLVKGEYFHIFFERTIVGELSPSPGKLLKH